MSPATATPIDRLRALVGCRFRLTDRLTVTDDRIRAYATATHNRHPVHWSTTAAARHGFPALVAPPTFAAVALLGAQREIMSALLPDRPAEAVLHTEQTLRIGRLLRAGDEVSTDIHVDAFRRYPDFAELVVTAALVDRHGVVVQMGTSTLSTALDPDAPGASGHRSPGMAELDRAPRPVLYRTESAPRGDVDPGTLAVGAPLPPAVTLLASADLAGYAHAVGDPVPDCGPGHPPAAAPGLLRLGLAAGFLTSWLGDPRAITGLRAEFTHCRADIGSAADAVRFEGTMVDVDASRRTALIGFDARFRGRRLFARADATVSLPGVRHTAPAAV